MLLNWISSRWNHLQISRKHIIYFFLVLLMLWGFHDYCTSLNSLERIDLSENGYISKDPHNVMDISSAHVRAKRHRGCWVFVVNDDHQFLFVKRSDDAPTCPATWSIIGEHTNFGESYADCAKRALKEEISVLRYRNLQPLEKEPVFLHLDYGSRVDKQWTQIYLVTVDRSLVRKSDIHEPQDVAWVNISQADKWLHECPLGICRYCNPANVWKMYRNHSYNYYYSFIEMTVEYLNLAMSAHENETIPLKRN